MVVKADLKLPASMLLFVFFLASRDDEIVNNFFRSTRSRVVQSCSRAISIFFTGGLVDHSWRATIRLHLTLPSCFLLGERAFAPKVRYSIVGLAQGLLTRQPMLI